MVTPHCLVSWIDDLEICRDRKVQTTPGLSLPSFTFSDLGFCIRGFNTKHYNIVKDLFYWINNQ